MIDSDLYDSVGSPLELAIKSNSLAEEVLLVEKKDVIIEGAGIFEYAINRAEMLLSAGRGEAIVEEGEVLSILSYLAEKHEEVLKGGETLLRSNNLKVKGLAEQLLRSRINEKGALGYLAIHIAAELGYLELVKYLFEPYWASITQKNNEGNLPIHSAAKSYNLEVVKYLLDKREMLEFLKSQI